MLGAATAAADEARMTLSLPARGRSVEGYRAAEIIGGLMDPPSLSGLRMGVVAGRLRLCTPLSLRWLALICAIASWHLALRHHISCSGSGSGCALCKRGHFTHCSGVLKKVEVEGKFVFVSCNRIHETTIADM